MRQPQLLLLAEDDAVELRDRRADQLDRVGLGDQCGNGSPWASHARRCATSALTRLLLLFDLARSVAGSRRCAYAPRRRFPPARFRRTCCCSTCFCSRSRSWHGLRLALLQTRQLGGRVIDQPGERRGDRALLDAGGCRRRQLRAGRNDAQLARFCPPPARRRGWRRESAGRPRRATGSGSQFRDFAEYRAGRGSAAPRGSPP